MTTVSSVRIRDVSVFLRGKKPSTTLDSPCDGVLPYILIENFAGTYKTYTNDPACMRCRPEDTIVVADGANTGLAITGHDGYLGSTLGAVRPDLSRVNPRYLFYFIHSNFNLLNTRTRGAAVPHLERDLLLDLVLALPPLLDQERIVQILDEAESLHRLSNQVDQRTDETAFALFVEMFGDPLSSGRRWPTQTLGNVCGQGGIKAGPFGSTLKKESYTAIGPRVYGQEQVIAGDFSVGDYHISEQKFVEMRAYAVQAGDVLISLVGTIGRAVVVPEAAEPGIINPRLLRIRPPKDVVSAQFLVAILTSPSAAMFFANIAGGITMGVLNATLLKDLSIIVPPVSLQEEYSARVTEVHTLKVAQTAIRRRLDDLFHSLLHRAFQGEL